MGTSLGRGWNLALIFLGWIIVTCLGSNLENIVFECDTQRPNGSPATSVHQLHPSDIKVVAAMGDSITAGNGIDASNIVEVFIQRRGQSWSIGGDSTFDEGIVTLPNILRKFNPDIIGPSMDQGSWYSRNANYNMAVPGSEAKDMVTQAWRLIWKLGNDTSVNYESDWKLLTVLVGGNDLCAFCTNRREYNATQYVSHLTDALDLLKDHVPRMLISIVAAPDVSIVSQFSRNWLCDIVQWSLCSCAKNLFTRAELKQLHWQYYGGLRNLLSSGRYDATDDFTVVLQPHLMRTLIPRLANGSIDLSYVAPDCFHPSERMHQLLAYTLWNTMMKPVSEKPLQYQLEDGERNLICPDENQPYIATSRNSPDGMYRTTEPQYRTTTMYATDTTSPWITPDDRQETPATDFTEMRTPRFSI